MLVVAGIVWAVSNSETPLQKLDREMKSINFNIDQNAVNEMKEGMKYGEQLAKDIYEKYKDDPVKYKEESDRIFKELLDKIERGE